MAGGGTSVLILVYWALLNTLSTNLRYKACLCPIFTYAGDIWRSEPACPGHSDTRSPEGAHSPTRNACLLPGRALGTTTTTRKFFWPGSGNAACGSRHPVKKGRAAARACHRNTSRCAVLTAVAAHACGAPRSCAPVHKDDHCDKVSTTMPWRLGITHRLPSGSAQSMVTSPTMHCAPGARVRVTCMHVCHC